MKSNWLIVLDFRVSVKNSRGYSWTLSRGVQGYSYNIVCRRRSRQMSPQGTDITLLNVAMYRVSLSQSLIWCLANNAITCWQHCLKWHYLECQHGTFLPDAFVLSILFLNLAQSRSFTGSMTSFFSRADLGFFPSSPCLFALVDALPHTAEVTFAMMVVISSRGGICIM